MGNNVKELRSQVRQVIQEKLYDFVPETLYRDLETKINAHMSNLVKNLKNEWAEIQKSSHTLITARIDALDKEVKEKLASIDKRHKDTMGYLIRQNPGPITKVSTVTKDITDKQ